MSKYPKNIWNQLKNISADELIKALQKDGWLQDVTCGAVQVFIKPQKENPNKRVTIHYHPKKTYQPGLLKNILDSIGWNEKEMRKLRLIK